MKNKKVKVFIVILVCVLIGVFVFAILGSDNPTESSQESQKPALTMVENATSEEMPWFEISQNGELGLTAPYRAARINKNYVSDNGFESNGSQYGKLPKQIVIPNTFNNIDVVSIRNAAFLGQDIIDVVIGDNVKTIGKTSFAVETIETVVLGKNIENIGANAFLFNRNLKEIIFPDTIKCIGESAFGGTAIKELILPDSIESIGKLAFNGCKNLKTVTIGSEASKIKTIGEYAFFDCSNVEEITIYANSTFVKFDNKWNVKDSNGNHQVVWIKPERKPVTVESINATSAEMPWFEITEAGEICFTPEYRASSTDDYLTDKGKRFTVGSKYHLLPENLVIPDTFNGILVTSIRDYAFHDYGTSTIKSVTIGNNVTKIGEHAFPFTVDEIVFGNKIEEIGAYAFDECKIIELVLPESIKRIGNNAFSGCIDLKEIVIPANLEYIGDGAFSNCNKLVNVEFSDIDNSKLIEIGKSSFANCGMLRNIILPDSLETINDRAFYGCKLDRIQIGVTDNCRFKYLGTDAIECMYADEIVYYNAWAAVTWMNSCCENKAECLYRFD